MSASCHYRLRSCQWREKTKERPDHSKLYALSFYFHHTFKSKKRNLKQDRSLKMALDLSKRSHLLILVLLLNPSNQQVIEAILARKFKVKCAFKSYFVFCQSQSIDFSDYLQAHTVSKIHFSSKNSKISYNSIL